MGQRILKNSNPGSRTPRVPTAVLVLALGVLASPVWAGVEIALETREGEGPAENGRIFIEGERLRMEPGGAPSEEGAMIYRGDRQLMWALRPSQQRYVQIDRETLASIVQTVDAARQQMEARLSEMPPEQREMMKRMMGGRSPLDAVPQPDAAAPMKIVKTDSRRDVDGHSCRVYELQRAGETHGDMCLVPWKEAGASRSNLKVFRSLAAFQRDLIGSLGVGRGPKGATEQPFEVFDELDGFPVETTHIRGGRVRSRTRYRVVGEGKQPAALFEIPDGWSREEMSRPGGP